MPGFPQLEEMSKARSNTNTSLRRFKHNVCVQIFINRINICRPIIRTEKSMHCVHGKVSRILTTYLISQYISYQQSGP